MSRLWTAVATVVVVAGAVLVYVVTSGGGDEPPAAAPPPTTSKPKPTLKPLALAPEATWSTQQGAYRHDIRDGLALVEDKQHLTLLDAATGATRWQLTRYQPLPAGDVEWVSPYVAAQSRLVAHNGGLAVLTGYSGDDSVNDQGLALLSAVDASVLWKTPLNVSSQYYDLNAVDDRPGVG